MSEALKPLSKEERVQLLLAMNEGHIKENLRLRRALLTVDGLENEREEIRNIQADLDLQIYRISQLEARQKKLVEVLKPLFHKLKDGHWYVSTNENEIDRAAEALREIGEGDLCRPTEPKPITR